MKLSHSTLRICISLVILASGAIFLASTHILGKRFHTGPVDRQIVTLILKNCARARPCALTLNDQVSAGDWDMFYLFSDQATKKEVEEALHTRIPAFREFSSGIGLMRNGKLVHFEQEDSDIEKPTPNSLNLELPAGKPYAAFPRNTIFTVSTERLEHSSYYILHPWPCLPNSQDKTGKECPLPE